MGERFVGDEITPGLAASQDQARERVTFLKIPIDIVEPNRLGLLAFQLLTEGKEQNIVLLSLWDLLRARRNAEYRDYVKNAALVIPISKSIISGIRFLLGKKRSAICRLNLR